MCWTTSETALGRSALVPSSRDLVAASGSPLLRSQGFSGIRRSDTEYHYHDRHELPRRLDQKVEWVKKSVIKNREKVGVGKTEAHFLGGRPQSQGSGEVVVRW